MLVSAVLVCVTRSERDGEGGYSEALEVEVFDVLGRKSLAERLAQNVLGVMAAAHDLHAWRGAHVLKQELSPGCASSFDRGFAVMGLLISKVAKLAGLSFHEAHISDTERPAFVVRVRKSLAACFGHLREEADRRENRDVLLQLHDRQAC